MPQEKVLYFLSAGRGTADKNKISAKSGNQNKYLLTVTKNGIIKKLQLSNLIIFAGRVSLPLH